MTNQRENFSQTEIATLQVLAILFTCINLIVFTTSLHNTIRYVIGLKIKKPLIVLYYIFTLLTSSYKIGLFIYTAIDPPEYYDKHFINSIESWAVFASIAYLLSLSTGFVLYLTMQ